MTTAVITTIALIFHTAGEFSVHGWGLILVFPCWKCSQFSTSKWEKGQWVHVPTKVKMSRISFTYTVLLLWFHNQSDTKMLGGLPGKEKWEKGGQGIQTNKMDGAGEVLPLSSCSCIQLRHVRAASPTLHWCWQQRRSWTPPERHLSPHFTSLPALSVFSTGVKADRSPPALALALQ